MRRIRGAGRTTFAALVKANNGIIRQTVAGLRNPPSDHA